MGIMVYSLLWGNAVQGFGFGANSRGLKVKGLQFAAAWSKI